MSLINDAVSFRLQTEALFESQLKDWELARKNYAELKNVEIRSLKLSSGEEMRLQFNPGRMRSSAAKVDADSIAARPCFLCEKNLPSEQQGLAFDDNYVVLVNPFPIFPRHLTIPHLSHVEQRIKGRLIDMMVLARALPDFVLFYNGPRCGASAPDHFHFQAGNKDFLPLLRHYKRKKSVIAENERLKISVVDPLVRKTLMLEGGDAADIDASFRFIFDFLEKLQQDGEEPMLNVLCIWEDNYWRLFIFPRKGHRPWQFYESGDDQIVLSPASVDFGGVLIAPRKEDYLKIQAPDVEDIFRQVTLNDEAWEDLISNVSTAFNI